MRKILSQLLLLVGLTLLFNACGSDSSTDAFSSPSSTTNSGSTVNTDPESSNDTTSQSSNRDTKSGTNVLFVDTFCTGLSYTTLSVTNTITGTGVTGEDGSANIPDNSEYIQFQIGGITLGKVQISQVITITELFANSNLSDNRVLFAARLLLSLDSDGNADNGIQISADVSDKIAYFRGVDSNNITNLNVNEETATKILTALLEFLNIDANNLVSVADAKLHLDDSMTELENNVYTVIIKPSDNNKSCPNGGVAKVHVVDFDTTDQDTTPTTYVDYFCDEINVNDITTNYELSVGNEVCPDGGIRVHHVIVGDNSRVALSLAPTNVVEEQNIFSEYDEYICNGIGAYTQNTYIIYTVTTANDNCKNVINKQVNVKKVNDISVISDNSFICSDREDNVVELVTLVEDSICVNGGVRADYFNDELKTDFISSIYYCNQTTDKGYVQGEHKIVAVEASLTDCPNGGTEFKHSVDYDNNGELETFYSEIKCDNSNGDNGDGDTNNGEVTIRTTKVLLTPDMEDSSKCPYGGYRLERVMIQGDRIIAEYNDYNCTDTTNLVRDDMTPIALKSSDYSSEANHWCPNGGFKYEHNVYYNNVLNHSYYDIECAPGSQVEHNTTTKLEVGNETCPNGGKIINVSVVFNGDAGHTSNYSYDVTICNGLNYDNTYEINSSTPLLFGDTTCPFGGEKILHQRYVNDTNEHLVDWDFTSTHCNSLEYDETFEDLQIIKVFVIGDGNTICPDGGKIVSHKRYVLENDAKVYIADWEYTTTHCTGIDYNQTKEVPQIIDNDPEVCPYGGKVILHQRFLIDENGDITSTHIAKWDYQTTVCNRLSYSGTLETIDEEILTIGNSICPDGGKIISHKRFIDVNTNGVVDSGDTHISDWDYSETICSGLDYDKTVEFLDITILKIGENDICPDGGKIIQHIKYLDADNDGIYTANIDTVRIPKWDYNTTNCGSLDYNDAKEIVTNHDLAIGSDICPDGGTIIEHTFFTDSDNDGVFETHIDKWDYNSTHCVGLNYSDTTECGSEVTLNIGSEICPDGGIVFDHKRCTADGTVIEKWSYSTTTCNGLEYDDTTECGSETVWGIGENSICPDGGAIFDHKRCTADGTVIEKWSYSTTTCNGLEYSDTVDCEITNILPIGDNTCPDGGEIVQHQRWTSTAGTCETKDVHVEKWDYTTTTCNGLEYSDTVDFETTTEANASECPYGGKVVLHERWTVDSDGQKDVHIAYWDYSSTYCTGDVKYVDNQTEIILPIGSEQCPNGGKLIEHNTTLNGVPTASYITVHCGREGTSDNTDLDTNITLSGYITDINGASIEGAKVSISIDDTLYEIITGVNGVYQLYNAQLGATVTVIADGFQVTQAVATSNILDFVLISEDLSYVNDMELKFFTIDREMGADKALEYARYKGWRLLTLEELTALYNSDRRSEFTAHEYFSSSVQESSINNDGYNLWTVRFTDGAIFPHWISFRKHVVFTIDTDNEALPSKKFVQTDHFTDWETAKSICASDEKRLPTVEEMKSIYFNSGYPIGVADENLDRGEYWTVNGDNETVKVFRVVGPVEDYYLEEHADPQMPKKVICVKYSDEIVTVKGTVTGKDGVPLKGIKVFYRTVVESLVTYTSITDENGEYKTILSANRYSITFNPNEYNVDSEIDYNSQILISDLNDDVTLDVKLLTDSNDDDNGDDNGNGDDDDQVCEDSNCSVVSFNVKSNFDADTNRWTYSIAKGENATVNKTHFTLTLSYLCMEQITQITGGTTVSLNSVGIIDSIQSDGNGEISFVVNSSSEYSQDLNSPLIISTDTDIKLSVNIASPICFNLAENNLVAGDVVDENGQAVAGATVQASVTDSTTGEDDKYEFTTDSTGSFSSEVELKLKNPTSQGSFTASKEGYTNSTATVITLERDVANTVGNLVLTAKEIQVSGIVTDAEGIALSDVTVVIKDANGETIETLTTNNDGVYSYATKIGTKISIEISKTLFISTKIATTTITMSLNQFNFQLEKDTIDVNVSLNVIDEFDKALIADASIVVKDSEDVAIYTGTADENGKISFTLNKLSGVNLVTSVVITAKDYAEKVIEITVEDSEVSQTVELVALPSEIIVLVTSTGVPLASAELKIFNSDNELIGSALTNNDGLIVLPNITYGNYKIMVTLANYNDYSKEILVNKNKSVYMSVDLEVIEEGNSSEITLIQGQYSAMFINYDDEQLSVGLTNFSIAVDFDSRVGSWNYTVTKTSNSGTSEELAYWYLDLDNTCLANLDEVTEGAVIGLDTESSDDPRDIIGSQTNVIKWNSTGKFSFKIKDGVQYKKGADIKVPVLFSTGTVGSNNNEGYAIVNISAPVCENLEN